MTNLNNIEGWSLKANPEKGEAPTIARELENMGMKGYGIMDAAHEMGAVSVPELTTFRDAISERVNQQASGEDAIEYQPDPTLPKKAQQRLISAHMIGSTAADIMLSDKAMRHYRRAA